MTHLYMSHSGRNAGFRHVPSGTTSPPPTNGRGAHACAPILVGTTATGARRTHMGANTQVRPYRHADCRVMARFYRHVVPNGTCRDAMYRVSVRRTACQKHRRPRRPSLRGVARHEAKQTGDNRDSWDNRPLRKIVSF
jgi:hypothetical protein